VLIVPISIARFASYAGARVPDAFTFLADVIYALGGPSPLTINPSDLMADGCHHNLGVANLVHYLNTRRSMPDISTMPATVSGAMYLISSLRPAGTTFGSAPPGSPGQLRAAQLLAALEQKLGTTKY